MSLSVPPFLIFFTAFTQVIFFKYVLTTLTISHLNVTIAPTVNLCGSTIISTFKLYFTKQHITNGIKQGTGLRQH